VHETEFKHQHNKLYVTCRRAPPDHNEAWGAVPDQHYDELGSLTTLKIHRGYYFDRTMMTATQHRVDRPGHITLPYDARGASDATE